MRILSINKRLYTNKDVLEDKYGRLYEIPLELAKLGNDVDCVTISYRKKKEGPYLLEDEGNPQWYSANLTPRSLMKLYKHTLALPERKKPDVIWAGSDVLHIAMALYFSKRFQIPLFVDFYDNYRSFGLTKIPGANYLLKAACKHAKGITVASKALQNLVENEYSGRRKILFLPNGVPRSLFRNHKKLGSRRALKIPEKAILIGTAGSLDRTRGINTLFEAFSSVAEKYCDTYLVIAGPRKPSQILPQHPRTIDLGVIGFELIPIFYSALDIGVVPNRDSDFGNYCSPMKAEEMIACNLPTVAARTKSTKLDLEHRGVILYDPENYRDLASKILYLIENTKNQNYISKTRYWDEMANELSQFLKLSKASGDIRLQE
ncbi:MAG: hypothetical protein CME38_00230 [Haliea sp.]|nr:hypothetical protein [Haliea sp.]